MPPVTATSPHKTISGCCTTCAWLSGACRVEIWTLTWSLQLNIEAMNDAYNSILIDEDYNALRDSIESFDRYDPMVLAKKLEKHPALEFRRLAAHLYKVWTSVMVWVFFC